jgi:uncharacterized membrane protein YccC
MTSIYGGRAGAVGTLALIVMLLNLLSIDEDYNSFSAAFLIAGGGFWYMLFSLLLYRIRPYRPVEQGLGEHLIAIADYVRARAAFYKEGADLAGCFNRVMREQSTVQDIQSQTQGLLFKTRKFLGDASPKSRSLMMIYLDSVELFEQTMYSYQDYELLHKALDHTGLPNKFYGMILELAADLEHIGITIQTGLAVKKNIDLTRRMDNLQRSIGQQFASTKDVQQIKSLEALEKILNNIQDIGNRINKLVLYTRMEGPLDTTADMAQKVTRMAVTQPLNLRILRQNLTFNSDIFRHALRLTIAMILAYVVSVLLSLTHSYWVLLTIVTIMRPAYSLTRKRNIERVAGTLVGVIVVSVILFFISNTAVLMAVMIISMLIGYSLLRMQYFGFVVFLTIFVIISFYFLNPHGFQPLIRERLIDTLLGSIIAFVASRFIFPVWGHSEIKLSMEKMLEANRQYFVQAWNALKSSQTETPAYVHARQDAIVALTNLSDNFQRMLSEPQQPAEATPVHQFVIANHMLTGHIAALSAEQLSGGEGYTTEVEHMATAITMELQSASDHLRHKQARTDIKQQNENTLAKQSLTQLSMIFALARDIRKISAKLV